MAELPHPFQSKEHVCIFELERKGGYFTSDVVWTLCGLKLSSANHTPLKDDVSSANSGRL
jgi:hypothetical protein